MHHGQLLAKKKLLDMPPEVDTELMAVIQRLEKAEDIKYDDDSGSYGNGGGKMEQEDGKYEDVLMAPAVIGMGAGEVFRRHVVEEFVGVTLVHLRFVVSLRTIVNLLGVYPVCVPIELLSAYLNLPQPSVVLVQCVSL